MKRLHTLAKQSEVGFTLIELLVVIVIAGVLAGIAAPSWFAFSNRQRAIAVRSDVIQAVKTAQQDAIQLRQARQIQVVTTATNPTLSIGSLDFSTGAAVFNGRQQVLGGEANKTGQITMTAYRALPNGGRDNTVNSIAFNHQGLPTDRNRLPFVINISGGPGTIQQCVIVANLLGSLKTANNTECDNPSVGLN
ncbi:MULTISPECIES: prepilin-type N-terminal cleavage/methylation domain-containing protein [Cyanophyceae]|uniref:pilus assembly FimT family protein n=1 Tax=Cyanophyceae TaxID=3028117 RepID=UPI00168632E6|nr:MULTISPECIES: prepilin-type N-terminal cleavage/methylation domain-containing protein [Cyanophyceae]MBD1916892.1 prepilin-type N-terminal cleavage/methylation domain-containing protein [Phormidium sp. FACHB-77]MBD2029898.1 prepilin-type N-terminal cleavage/methylation domain-containing protein [Phormidium sp. FACHB-322]MBD2053094.1 prepilin-type N-terminal cleavage/methylation domain-containing protein [Leptolyngbya sp. FACHB-60]